MTWPVRSVMLTMVLLNEAWTCAMPVWTFLLPFALMILICSTTALGSSERFSSFFGSAGAEPASFFAAFLTFGAFAGASVVAVAAAAGASAAGAAGVSDSAFAAVGSM